MIELLTGLPLVVAFFLDQWFHRGVPLWILYSLFCVQAGDSWSSQYLLVFWLHLHHCVSFLLVDWWDIGSFLHSIYLHLSIQFIHIYLFNIFTFIHYACVQVKENVNWKKEELCPKFISYFEFNQNTHVYFFLLIVFKVQLVSLLVSGLSPRFTESSKSTKDLALSVLWRNHLLWYKQQTIEKKFKKKKKKRKKGWKNSHCLSDYYMDLLNILLWLYVQVLCNLFKGKQIDNLKA